MEAEIERLREQYPGARIIVEQAQRSTSADDAAKETSGTDPDPADDGEVDGTRLMRIMRHSTRRKGASAGSSLVVILRNALRPWPSASPPLLA